VRPSAVEVIMPGDTEQRRTGGHEAPGEDGELFSTID
jgi:hypothetical protein